MQLNYLVNIIVTSIVMLATQSCSTSLKGENERASLNNNKPVCKNYTPTNSRIAVRTCRPQEEWDEIERTAKDRLDNISKTQTNNPQGFDPQGFDPQSFDLQ